MCILCILSRYSLNSQALAKMDSGSSGTRQLDVPASQS
ncbi:LOW QUALITY PROTEIN: ubiquitin fusion degradaton protein, putative [Schistosoma mansoni]|nr:LOW QUALITY PROTEIN: ubiquitin fusion degradaton protein, putative [Schistosoma mansoni]|eukprot:XP_018644230.1 LOW QUALITY PROTEIN: ubiquitin fusion degradaton protein, putative [Schistosoma mansoni]